MLSNYLVTNTGYGIPGSLDTAISAAITAQDSDAQIHFSGIANDSTISLSAGDISSVTDYGPTAYVISGTGVNITIDGTLVPGLTIDGGNAIRLFAVASTATLTLEHLTVSGGLSQGGAGADGGGGGGGGGAGLGGAVYNDGGTFTANGVTFVNNSAIGGAGGAGGVVGDNFDGGDGGGVNGGSGGTDAYTSEGTGGAGGFGGGGGGGQGSVGKHGGSGGFGGGGGGGGGHYTSHEGANGYSGGFGAGMGGNGTSNKGGGGGGGGVGYGGAIFSNGGSLTLINSTLTGNSALGGAGGSGQNKGQDGFGRGGAVFIRNSSVTVVATTMAANYVGGGADPSGEASDVYLLSDGNLAPTTTTFANTILGTQPMSGVHEITTAVINGGAGFDFSGCSHNIVQHENYGDGLPDYSIVFSGDPMLAPLADNGGPTQTMGLLPGSPAIGSGVYPAAINPITDQRNVLRIGARDIGAYQVKEDASVTAGSLSLDLGSTVYGTPSSPPQSFTVSGSLLVSDLIVEAPVGVEVSLDGTNWFSSVSIPELSGTVPTTSVYARISSNALPGDLSTSITVRSAEDAFASVAITGTVERQATSYVVTDGADTAGSSSDVTLRYAITQAMANLENATITFAPEMINLDGNTITLTTADANIMYGATAFILDNVAITIDGSDHPGLWISGGDALRPFVVTISATLTLKNLTISGGMAQGGSGTSGGTYSSGGGGGGGAGLGGGVYVDGGSLTVDGVTFTNNVAQGGTGGDGNSDAPGSGGNGGGYLGGAGGTGSNWGQSGGYGGGGGGGGALQSQSGGGGGQGGFGGGGGGGGGKGRTDGYLGPGGNAGFGGGAGVVGGSHQGGGGGGGAGLGGAIFANGGSITLINSTLTGNSAIGGAGGAGYTQGEAGAGLGGALFARNARVRATFTTFSSNTVANGDATDGNGSDVYLLGDGNGTAEVIAIVDSILGQGGVSTINDFASSVINGGTNPNYFSSTNNIVTNNPLSGGLPPDTIVYSGNPMIGSLSNNGGPTWTMALLPGSPAIGAGTPAGYPGTMTPITTDQRGVTRVTYDIGSVAYSSITVSPSSLDLGTVTQGTAGNSQSFTVSGDQLAGDISLVAPNGVELSTDGTNWSTSLSVPQSGGSVSSTTVYARISASADVGSISDSIAVTSPGASEQDIAVSGSVTTIPASISVSVMNLVLGVTQVGTAGPTKSFTVSGSHLTSDIEMAGVTGAEMSTDGTNWSATLTLPETGGVVDTTTIYVRISASATVGLVAGPLVITSTDAVPKLVMLIGAIEPQITLSPSTLSDATIGDLYTQQLSAAGGSGTGYTYTSTDLPDWLTMSPSGLLMGTPATTIGSPFSFTVLVTDDREVSQSFNYTITVAKASTNAGDIVSSAPQVFYGQTVTLTATFTANAVGSAPLTGTVAFYDGATYLGTAPMGPSGAISAALVPIGTPAVNVSGQASLATSQLSVGTHSITAVYSGNAVYSSTSSESSVSVLVEEATTSTTLKSVTTTGGTTLVSTVVATSPGNPTLVGTVSFYDGTTLLATVPLTNGVATLPLGVLPAGQHSFSAIFNGNGTAFSSTAAVTVTTGGPEIIGMSRYGFHDRSTSLVLYFNAPLDPARAQDVSNYVITDASGRRIAINSATYDPSTLTVSLRPSTRLNIHQAYRLTVNGKGATALTDIAGTPLDGMSNGGSGTNFVTMITWRALSVPGNTPAITYVNGQEHAYQGKFNRYVNAVVRATKAAGHSAKNSVHAVFAHKAAKAHAVKPTIHDSAQAR